MIPLLKYTILFIYHCLLLIIIAFFLPIIVLIIIFKSQVQALQVTGNPFSTNLPLLHPLKTSENRRFYYLFKGHNSGTLVENVLKCLFRCLVVVFYS